MTEKHEPTGSENLARVRGLGDWSREKGEAKQFKSDTKLKKEKEKKKGENEFCSFFSFSPEGFH